MDIPASDPDSSGIFDGKIEPAPGKTLRETTKELVETLRADAIKYQGYAFRDLMEKYVNDPHGLVHLRNYKEQFERDAVLPDMHNAYYRVRTNFAVMYAAAALAIDYESFLGKSVNIPGHRKVYAASIGRAGNRRKELTAPIPVDARHLGRTLKELLPRLNW